MSTKETYFNIKPEVQQKIEDFVRSTKKRPEILKISTDIFKGKAIKICGLQVVETDTKGILAVF